MALLVKSEIRKLFKQHGKQLTDEVWQILNGFVSDKIEKACTVHNGNRARIDASVLGFVGITTNRWLPQTLTK